MYLSSHVSTTVILRIMICFWFWGYPCSALDAWAQPKNNQVSIFLFTLKFKIQDNLLIY